MNSPRSSNAAVETYAAVLERNHALARWITEPVGGEG